MRTQQKSEQRQTKLVDKDLQVGFGMKLARYVLIYAIGFMAMASLAPAAYTLFLDGGDAASNALMYDGKVLLRVVVAPILLTCLAVSIFAIREMFRISGPNMRFKWVFRDLQKLRIPRSVSIRETDHLQETANELNKALLVLNELFVNLKLTTSRALEEREADSAEPSAQEALAEIEKILKEVEILGVAPEYAAMDNATPNSPQSSPCQELPKEDRSS